MKDAQQFMQVFMDLVQEMPAAVEFPFFKSCGAVEVSAVAAATLLQQVMDLLDVAYPIVERESLRPQHSEGIDEDVFKLFHVRIPIRPLTPRPSINDQLSCDCAEELKRFVDEFSTFTVISVYRRSFFNGLNIFAYEKGL